MMQRVKSLGFIKNAAIIISSSFYLHFIIFAYDLCTYLRQLFILIPYLIKLVFYLVFQFNQELSLHLSYSYLTEFVHSQLFGFLVEFLQFILKNGRSQLKVLLEISLKFLIGLHLSFEAFIFTNVAPSTFNVWHCTLIDGFNVRGSEIVEHFSIQLTTMHKFWLYSIYYLSTELHHLLYKLRSKFLKLHLLKTLKILFFSERSNHGAAVSFLEERFQHPSDSILLFNTI